MDENIKHAEATTASFKQSVGNPVTSSLNVVVSVPDSIEIRMVDASVLSDYEVWFSISSVLASTIIGFLVAYFQAVEVKAQNASQLGYTVIVFAILFIISVFTTYCKRRLLRKKGKSIKLKATNESIE
jgi:type III secretory pathway component EscS